MRVTAIRKLFLLGRLSPLSLDLRWFFVYLKNQCKLRLSSFNNECVKKSILDQKKKKKTILINLWPCCEVSRRERSHTYLSIHPAHWVSLCSFPRDTQRRGSCDLKLICGGATDTPDGVTQAGKAASRSRALDEELLAWILRCTWLFAGPVPGSPKSQFLPSIKQGKNSTARICLTSGLMQVNVPARL